ncbi:Gfo/Idh/MocA family protein [Paenibacillus nasutitermitis]|uniref:Gfo/Idh/MocA family oxidoreductase n=1 Tax=Paenibacillus nasutitermitis TaxID=1652958 RepID=A0A916ZD83_9BACL|nr:Gfo/Idh/MocA family oxidoreductase [Paenibacillus nasutitermitis]GGD89836.1 hypothetical protein GCM10010911_55620 [Paenibacillus nasutitermitis]
MQIGFIGCGDIARIHAQCLLNSGSIIRGAFDIVSTSALRFVEAYGGRVYATAADLCADPDIQAVYICTRHDSHVQYIDLASLHNKPIYCEKPLGLNAVEARRAAELVDQRNTKLMIGFNHRYSSGVMALKGFLKKQTKKFNVMNIIFVSEPFLEGWPGTADEGGGVIVCLGSHVFDLVNYLCGEEIVDIKVTALRNRANESLLEDTFGAIFKTKHNQLITISSHDLATSSFADTPGHNLNTIHVAIDDLMVTAQTSKINIYGSDYIETHEYPTDKLDSWGYQEINNAFLRYVNGSQEEIPDVHQGVKAAEIVEQCERQIRGLRFERM